MFYFADLCAVFAFYVNFFKRFAWSWPTSTAPHIAQVYAATNVESFYHRVLVPCPAANLWNVNRSREKMLFYALQYFLLKFLKAKTHFGYNYEYKYRIFLHKLFIIYINFLFYIYTYCL